jgi:hypothetical protein
MTSDYRFNHNSPLQYIPFGLFIKEDFKANPNKRNVWYEPTDISRTELVTVTEENLCYTDISNQVDFYLNKTIPYFLYHLVEERSQRYDESDRVLSKCVGFIFINCFAKQEEQFNSLCVDDVKLTSFSPRDDISILETNKKLAFSAGKKWADIQYKVKTCISTNTLTKDLMYLSLYNLYDSDVVKYAESIVKMEPEDEEKATWKCIINGVINLEINLESSITIGFPLEIKESYEYAQVQFSNGDRVFYKSDIINLVNIEHDYPNDSYW